LLTHFTRINEHNISFSTYLLDYLGYFQMAL
jgi:hypothetical protein